MKARRKSDGKIIEVKEWRGASDVIYSSPDMNQFYQASELDFNLDAGTAISGWACRNKEGDIFLYKHEPKRIYDGEYSRWEEDVVCTQPLPHELFPDLAWESDPIKVSISIKRKKK